MSLNMYLYNENQKDHSFKSWTKNYALDYSVCLICNIKNSSQISHLNSKELKRIVKGLTKTKSNIQHNRSDNIKYKDIANAWKEFNGELSIENLERCIDTFNKAYETSIKEKVDFLYFVA